MHVRAVNEVHLEIALCHNLASRNECRSLWDAFIAARTHRLIVNGADIEAVTEFHYLGCTVIGWCESPDIAKILEEAGLYLIQNYLAETATTGGLCSG